MPLGLIVSISLSQIQLLPLNGLDYKKRQGGEPYQDLNFITLLLTIPGIKGRVCSCRVCVLFAIYQLS